MADHLKKANIWGILDDEKDTPKSNFYGDLFSTPGGLTIDELWKEIIHLRADRAKTHKTSKSS